VIQEKGKDMTRAFLFPGQGAQTIGMGRDLAENWTEARAVFEEVDDSLGESLSSLIWNGDIATLTLTANAQPALMACSLAAVRALQAEGVPIDAAAYVAGHSLGEYSALTAAGALTIGDAARLLRARGEAMQAAVPVGQGAMAAILGLNFETVQSVVAAAAQGQVCAAANDNDPAQVVVSGHKDAVERAAADAKEAGAKRALMLPVSAPFHCSLMEPAARAMAQALAEVDILRPAVPVVANVVAEAISDPATIRSLLVDQICGSVRWRD
jgi:[acyl-carrier-protein] S-malonyltransferase